MRAAGRHHTRTPVPGSRWSPVLGSRWSLLLPVLVAGLILLPTRTLAAMHVAAGTHRATLAHVGTLQVQLDAGFATYYRPAAWVPIRVRLTNTGPQLAGRIRVLDAGQQTGMSASPAGTTEYSRSILLPEGAVQAFTLYLPGADLGQSVTVSVEGTVAGTVAGARPTTVTLVSALNPVPLGTILAGVLSRGSGLLAQLKGGQVADVATAAVRLDAASLDPNPLALASFDLLVIGDFNSCALSRPTQGAALEDWVRAGGTLVEIGGPTAQGTVGCLPAALQLLAPGEPLVLNSLPGLAAAAGGPPLPAGHYLAGVGPVRAGTVLLDQQGYRTLGGDRTPGGPATRHPTTGGPATRVPLVLEERLGLGNVLYSAIDPTLGNLAGWRGLPGLWRLLAGDVRSAAATTTTSLDGTMPTATQAVAGSSGIDAEIDTVSPPSITLFIALLILYVLVLVPLNFILLGRMKRRDLSWLTLPALVLLLVAYIFGSAYLGRSRNVRASLASTVFLTSGSNRVIAQHYVGVFAPIAGDYTLASDDPLLLGSPLFYPTQNGTGTNVTQALPGTTTTLFSQDSGQASLLRMGMWTSRNAAISGIVAFTGGLSGVAVAHADGSIGATLTNTTGATIYGVLLDAMGTFQTVGDVAAGKTVTVRLTSGAPTTNPAQRQSASDYYGSLAALLSAAPARPQLAHTPHLNTGFPVPARHQHRAQHNTPPGTAQLATNSPTTPNAAPWFPVPGPRYLAGGPVRASLSAAPLAEGVAARLAARLAEGVPGGIQTNPDETRSSRFAKVLAQAPIDASPASLGPLVVFGWSALPISGFAVNGDHPHRQDTDLLVESLPLTLADGPFHLSDGTIPARLAGSDAELQQSGFGGGGGFTINSQSNVIFVAQVPLPANPRHTAHLRAVTLTIYQGNGAGGALSPQSAALYNWRLGRWEGVDASSGTVTIGGTDPGRFIDAAGRIRVRLSAQDSSIGIADANSGMAIGLSGEVRSR